MDIILQSIERDCQFSERHGTTASKDVDDTVHQIIEDLSRNGCLFYK